MNCVLPDAKVTNFHSDWCDGKILLALINYLTPNFTPISEPTSSLERVKRAMAAAANSLGIPLILEAETVTDGKSDERAMMLYMSYFILHGQKTFLDWVDSQIPNNSLSSFSGDWTDGLLLGALVNSLSGDKFESCSKMSSQDSLSNLASGMNAALNLLSVQKTVTNEQFSSPTLDNLSRLSYLSQFYRASVKGSISMPMPTAPDKVLVGQVQIPRNVGDDVWLEVDCSDAGFGNLSGEVEGKETGRIPVTIKPAGASNAEQNCYHLLFTPPKADVYTFSVLYDSQHVPGSPIVVNLHPPDPNKVKHVETTKAEEKDEVAMVFDTVDAGQGKLKAKAFGEIGGSIPIKVSLEPNGTYILTFAPPFPDIFKVDVLWGKFCANAVGELTGLVPLEVSQDDKHECSVTFKPPTPDVYTVDVNWDGKPVPGSPFIIDLLPPCSPEQIECALPIYSGAGEEAELLVDASRAGSGDLTAECIGNMVGEIPVQLNSLGGRAYQVSFIPPQPDLYNLNVKYGDKHVKGSPFEIDMRPGVEPETGEVEVEILCDPTKCKIVEAPIENVVLVNRPIVFTVDTHDAGTSELVIEVDGPTPTAVTANERPDKKGTYDISFKPKTSGSYRINVLWSNKPIAGAPLEVNAIGCDAVDHYPHGKPISFDIEAEGKTTDLEAYAIHNDSGTKYKAKISKIGKGKHKINFSPKQHGLYFLHVSLKDKPIRESPFSLFYSLPLKPDACRVDGFTSICYLNYPMKFLVDGSDAGLGELSIKPTGPRNKKDKYNLSVSDNKDFTYAANYTPHAEGQHNLTILWGGKQIAGSPFSTTAKQFNATTNIFIVENLNKETQRKVKVDSSAEGIMIPLDKSILINFKLDERMGLRDEHVKSEILGKKTGVALPGINKEPDGTYDVVFDPSQPDTYQIAVEVNEMKLPKTPITVTVSDSSSNLSSLQVEESFEVQRKIEEGIKPWTIPEVPKMVPISEPKHKEIDIEIGNEMKLKVRPQTDEQKAGSLVANVNGKQTGPGELNVSQTDEGIFLVRFNPSQPDHYIIDVELNGQKVPSSPFYINYYAKPISEQSMEIELTGESPEALRAKCIGDTCGEIPVQIAETGPGTRKYKLQIKPTQEDRYLIYVTHKEKEIKNSPFVIDLRKATKELSMEPEEFVPITETLSAKSLEYAPSSSDNGDEFDESEDFTPQDAPLTEFTQFVGRALNIKIRPETEAQRNGELKAHVIGDKTGESNVKVLKLPDENFLVEFNPKLPDRYTVTVKLNDEDVPHTPFAVKYVLPETDASKCKLIGVDEISYPVEVGNEISLMVDASNAGPGELQVKSKETPEAKNPSVPIVSPRSGEKAKYNVYYTPNSHGYHNLEFTWAGKAIPLSPVNVLAVSMEDVEFYHYGKPVASEINFDGKDAKLKIVQKETGTIVKGKLSKVQKGKYKVTFNPKMPGLYYLHIYSKDTEIPSSPFVIKYGKPIKPEECIVSGLEESCFLGESLTFDIDAKQAGDGILNVNAVGPDKKSTGKTNVNDIKDGTYSVTFTPDKIGDHKIHILLSDKPVPGSPYKLKVKDLAKKQLITKLYLVDRIGNRKVMALPYVGVLETTTDQKVLLSVKTRNVEQRQQKFHATAFPSNSENQLPLNISIEEDTYFVSFQPTQSGSYNLSAQLDEKEITGMPLQLKYTVPPPQASQCKIIGLDDQPAVSMVGKNIFFQVDTRLAGDGKVSIKGESPRGKPSIQAAANTLDKRIIDVTYVPNAPGLHRVSVAWSGEEIPKSPLSFQVEPIPVYPNGKTVTFDFGEEAKESDMHCLVFHEESGSRLKGKIAKLAKNKFSINFKPRVPGLYSINVYVKMREIKNSPFYIRYAAPAKPDAVVVRDIPEEAYVKETYNFAVDTTNAGLSELKVKVTPPKKGKDGNLSVVDHKDGIYMVHHTPEVIGNHVFSVSWDKKKIPQSPVTVNVGKRVPVVKSSLGSYTNIVPVGDTVNVDVDNVGKHESLDFVRASVKPNKLKSKDAPVIKKKDGKHSVQFTPTVADDYLLNLFMHETEVEGSPFLVKAIDKETLSPKFERPAEYLPSDVECGKPVSLILPQGEDSTDSNKNVSVTGPEGPCEVNYEGQLESSRGIGFVPTVPGDYIVDVTKQPDSNEKRSYKIHATEKTSDAKLVVLTPESLKKIVEPIPVGETEEFDVDTSKSGNGKLKARQKGQGSGKMVLKDKGNDIYGLSITPTAAGKCELDILMNDESICESPFSLQYIPGLPKADRCVLENITESPVVNTAITFTVNAKEAGSGELNVAVKAPQEKPGEEQPTLKLNDNGDQTYSVEYVPNVLGDHTFDVKWSDKSIPGSPFTVPVTDDLISEILNSLSSQYLGDGVINRPPVEESIPSHIIEEGDLEPQPAEESSMDLDLSEEGPGTITAQCFGDTCGEIPVEVVETVPETKKYKLRIQPKEKDRYAIHVKHNDQEIKKSPFIVDLRPSIQGESEPDMVNVIVEVKEMKPVEYTLPQLEPEDKEDEISPQDTIVQEFTQFIGRALNVKIRPETEEDRNGEVEATIVGDVTGENDVKTVQLPDDTFVVQFNPSKPDRYFVTVKLNGSDVPNTPFYVKYIMPITNSSKCRLIGKEDICHPTEMGTEITLLVDAADAGPGELNVESRPTDTNNPSILKVSPRSEEKAKYEVSYTPNTSGYHDLEFTWGGKPIPDSPVRFMVIDTNDVEFVPYGKSAATDFDTDGKDLKLKIVHKETGNLFKGKLSKVEKGKYKAAFSPKLPGLHYIHMYSKDKEIPSSPYVIRYGKPPKPEACKVTGMEESCYIGEVIDFQVDTRKAGDGDLKIIAIGSDKKPTGEVTVVDVKDGIHTAMFTPEKTGNHRLKISWGEKPVSGSPFPVTVKDISKEQLITKLYFINRMGIRENIEFPCKKDHLITTTDNTLLLTVKTRTDNQKTGKFSTTVLNNITQENEAVKVIQENDTFQAYFEPSSAGKYTLSADLNETTILGTPLSLEYTIPPPDASKCKIIGLEDHPTRFSVGKNIFFQIDTRLAGDGKINVKGQSPRGKPDMKVNPNSSEQRIVDVTYVPNVPGTHKVNVAWSGEEVSQSPLYFDVEPIPVYPNARPIAFNFDVEAKESDLHCLVFQEDTGSRLKGKISKTSNNKFTVHFKPRVPGLYSINVYAKMREIKNSPFFVRYAPPPKPDAVLIMDVPNEIFIDEPYSFTVDAKDAGISQLGVKVIPPKKAKSGDLHVTNHKDGIYTVQHIPHATGKHSFDITWDKKPIPEIPLVVEVQSQTIQPEVAEIPLEALPTQYEEKLPRIVSLPDSTIVLGDSIDIDIEVKDIPRGALKINQSGDGKAGVQFKKKSKGIIGCTVTPTALGTCTLNFLFNDKNIEGSPCVLNYCGLAGVNLEGEAMQVGTVHKYSIGCGAIHDGTLEVSCGEDDSFAAEISKNYMEEEQAYQCTILPKQAGPNTISVKYNGNHVIGSPFNVEFIPQEPSNIALTLATPTGIEQSGLTANIETSSGGQVLPVTLNQLLGGQYSIDFVPTQESDYVLTIKCNLRIKREEKELAEKFNLNYTAIPIFATDCTVEGSGIITAEVGMWSTFTVKAKDEGDLSVIFEDANSVASGPVVKTVTPLLEYEVKYLVKKCGKFQITLHWNGKPIPGSPFDVNCIMPESFSPRSQIDDISTTIAQGKPLQFTFKPASDIPGGELGVSAYSKMVGVVMGSYEMTNEGKYKCTVHLEHLGRYLVQVDWDNKPIEGAPFQIDVVEPSRPENVKVFGPGLEEAVVGQKGTFTIDTTEAGHGNIAVDITGPEGQFLVDLEQDHAQEKDASYLPQQAGRYI